MNKTFYKKVINLIPSADMKNYVFLKEVPQEIIDGYNYAAPILKKIAEED